MPCWHLEVFLGFFHISRTQSAPLGNTMTLRGTKVSACGAPCRRQEAGPPGSGLAGSLPLLRPVPSLGSGHPSRTRTPDPEAPRWPLRRAHPDPPPPSGRRSGASQRPDPAPEQRNAGIPRAGAQTAKQKRRPGCSGCPPPRGQTLWARRREGRARRSPAKVTDPTRPPAGQLQLQIRSGSDPGPEQY